MRISPAKELFTQFVERGFDRIKECLDESDVESPFIDFKENKTNPATKGETGKTIDKLTKDGAHVFGKAASAFANTEGGLIVWGVEAKDNKPKALSPIPNIDRFRQSLEDRTNDVLDPVLTGILHHTVYGPEGDGSGFAVTYVPRSKRRPHMCAQGDRTYYMRSGSNSVAMGHRLVHDMMIARAAPELHLTTRKPTHLKTDIERAAAGLRYGGDERHVNTFTIEIQVTNHGEVLSQDCAIAIEALDKVNFRPRVTQDATTVVVRDQDSGAVFRASLYITNSTAKIYPGNTVLVGAVHYQFHEVETPTGTAQAAVPLIFRYALYARDFSSIGTIEVAASDMHLDFEVCNRK